MKSMRGEKKEESTLPPIDSLLLTTQEFSISFGSVAQSCPTLCNSMDRSTPGFPVHHQLPELAQTQVH